ncbi:hypothetical protein ScPMuIL_010362 [Solemya velum]
MCGVTVVYCRAMELDFDSVRNNTETTEILGKVFSKTGSTLELVCRIRTDNNLNNAQHLFVQHCNNGRCENVSVQYIDNSSVKASFKKITNASRGSYRCCLGQCTVNSPSKIVEVGDHPRIEGLDCISDGGCDMNCTVRSNVSDVLKRTLSLTYGLDVLKINYSCPELEGMSCYWPEEKFSAAFKSYTITTKLSNILGDDYAEYKINVVKIIKPGPVISPSVTAENSTSLIVSFTRPDIHVRPSLFPLNYSVSLTSKWNQNHVKVFPNSIAEKQSFTLYRLIPDTNYNVSIYSIYSENDYPDIDRYKSKVWRERVKTQPDVPSSSPDMTPDSYTEFTCDNEHFYIVYWNPIDDIKKNGQFLQYAVTTLQAVDIYQPNLTNSCGMMKLQRKSPTEALQIPGSVLILSKMEEIHLEIRSMNQKGLSESVSEILMQKGEVLSKPKAVMAELAENDAGNKYLVSFEMADTDTELTGVTYYWCQGQEITVGYIDCKNLYWNQTDGKSRSQWIMPAGASASGTSDEWHFAVSVQQGNSSSGMVWQNCLFKSYGKEVPYNGAKNVSLAPGPDSSTQVKLKLHFDYCDLPTKPAAYNISYWVMGAKRDTFKVKVIVGEELYDHRTFLLSNLESDTVYGVEFCAYNEFVNITRKEVEIATSPAPEEPEPSTPIMIVIPATVVSVLVLPLLLLLLWYCWKQRKIYIRATTFDPPAITLEHHYSTVSDEVDFTRMGVWTEEYQTVRTADRVPVAQEERVYLMSKTEEEEEVYSGSFQNHQNIGDQSALEYICHGENNENLGAPITSSEQLNDQPQPGPGYMRMEEMKLDSQVRPQIAMSRNHITQEDGRDGELRGVNQRSHLSTVDGSGKLLDGYSADEYVVSVINDENSKDERDEIQSIQLEMHLKFNRADDADNTPNRYSANEYVVSVINDKNSKDEDSKDEKNENQSVQLDMHLKSNRADDADNTPNRYSANEYVVSVINDKNSKDEDSKDEKNENQSVQLDMHLKSNRADDADNTPNRYSANEYVVSVTNDENSKNEISKDKKNENQSVQLDMHLKSNRADDADNTPNRYSADEYVVSVTNDENSKNENSKDKKNENKSVQLDMHLKSNRADDTGNTPNRYSAEGYVVSVFNGETKDGNFKNDRGVDRNIQHGMDLKSNTPDDTDNTPNRYSAEKYVVPVCNGETKDGKFKNDRGVDRNIQHGMELESNTLDDTDSYSVRGPEKSKSNNSECGSYVLPVRLEEP